MVRINAAAHSAQMVWRHAFGNASSQQFPSDSMGFCVLSMKPEPPVSTGGKVSHPQPATAGYLLLDLVPKLLFCHGCESSGCSQRGSSGIVRNCTSLLCFSR